MGCGCSLLHRQFHGFSARWKAVLLYLFACVKKYQNRFRVFDTFIKIYLVFPRLPFGIVAYAFTLFWTTFHEIAVCHRVKSCVNFEVGGFQNRGVCPQAFPSSLLPSPSPPPPPTSLFCARPISRWKRLLQASPSRIYFIERKSIAMRKPNPRYTLKL